MTEWKEIGTAPRDGTPILGWCSINETQVVSWFEPLYNKWISHLSHSDDDEDPNIPSGITHWIELPAPPKKTHQCEGFAYKVTTDEHGNLVIPSYNQHGRSMVLLCNFCPICGAKE